MSCCWFIMTKVLALPGSDFPGSPGAEIWVEAFVPCMDIHDALTESRSALLADRYEVVDVSRCLRVDSDDPELDEDARTIAKRVAKNGQIEFGPFCHD